jgi:hypothetical protein
MLATRSAHHVEYRPRVRVNRAPECPAGRALRYAAETGAEAIQVFVSNPRGTLKALRGQGQAARAPAGAMR